jgi:hypothetical protein
MSAARLAGASWRNGLVLAETDTQLAGRFRFKDKQRNLLMRTILLSFITAIVFLGAFTSCSTSVKTDSGHGVTAGVH